MNELGHKYIVRSAVRCLPDWCKKLVLPYGKLIELAANYPDIFEGAGKSEEEKARVDVNWRKYIDFPDNLSAHSGKAEEPITYIRQLEFYHKNVIENVRAEKMDEALKYACGLSHIIGDIGQPIHQVDERIVLKLFPPPEHIKYIEVHNKIESYAGEPDMGGYLPNLLGLTEKQIFVGLMNRLNGLAHKVAKYVVEIIQAIYEGKSEEEINGISSEPIRFCAEIFSDYVYSVFALNYKRIDSEQAKQMRQIDLRKIRPIKQDVEFLYNYEILLDESLIPYSDGKTVPFELFINNCRNKVKGIGMMPYSGHDESVSRIAFATYLLAEDTRYIFESRVGLNAGIESKQTPVKFAIFVDDEMIWQSQLLETDMEAEEISIKLPVGGKFLKLQCEYVRPHKSPLYLSHCVWAEPKLIVC